LFGIGGWEFMVIAFLAVLLFGPDKLPEFARTIGRFMRDFRRYQAMMESTIKAEVFATDPRLQRDPFKTGKDFREKVEAEAAAAPTPGAGDTPTPETPDAPAPDATGEGDEATPESAPED